MALLQQAQQPQQPPAPQGQPQQAPQKGDPQSQYKGFMKQLGEFVTSQEGVDTITSAFDSKLPIDQAISMVVSKIFQGIFMQAQKAGKQLPPQMVARAMLEILQVVIQYAIDAGKITEEEAGSQAKDITMNTSNELAKSIGGQLSDGERQAYMKMQQAIGGL